MLAKTELKCEQAFFLVQSGGRQHFSCQVRCPKDSFPLAKCSPWVLINPFLGHRAALLNLCRRFGPAPSFLSSRMLHSVCVCVRARCTGIAFQKVEGFLAFSPRPYPISVWMFSRSFGGTRWRLPCCVPQTPAVRFSEKLAEECDVWEEKQIWFSPLCTFFTFITSLPSLTLTSCPSLLPSCLNPS